MTLTIPEYLTIINFLDGLDLEEGLWLPVFRGLWVLSEEKKCANMLWCAVWFLLLSLDNIVMLIKWIKLNQECRQQNYPIWADVSNISTTTVHESVFCVPWCTLVTCHACGPVIVALQICNHYFVHCSNYFQVGPIATILFYRLFEGRMKWYEEPDLSLSRMFDTPALNAQGLNWHECTTWLADPCLISWGLRAEWGTLGFSQCWLVNIQIHKEKYSQENKLANVTIWPSGIHRGKC